MCLIIQLCSEAALVSFFCCCRSSKYMEDCYQPQRMEESSTSCEGSATACQTNESVSNVCKHVAH